MAAPAAEAPPPPARRAGGVIALPPVEPGSASSRGGRRAGPRAALAPGGMAAAAELQAKYQKLAQEYSKVPGARARPRCSASAAAAPLLLPVPSPSSRFLRAGCRPPLRGERSGAERAGARPGQPASPLLWSGRALSSPAWPGCLRLGAAAGAGAWSGLKRAFLCQLEAFGAQSLP